MSQNSDFSSCSSDDSHISDEETYALERRRFKKTFKIEDELARSANGIIYNGYKKNDKSERVVIKLIPRKKNLEFKHEDRIKGVPREIYYHFKAAEASSYVIKPLDWFESHSSYCLVMEKLDGFS